MSLPKIKGRREMDTTGTNSLQIMGSCSNGTLFWKTSIVAIVESKPEFLEEESTYFQEID